MTQCPSAEDLIDGYQPNTPVIANGMPMSLEQALQFEAMFCPASAETRTDPHARARYLAGILFAGDSLRPEHVEAFGLA